jgi:hypothetical protein
VEAATNGRAHFMKVVRESSDKYFFAGECATDSIKERKKRAAWWLQDLRYTCAAPKVSILAVSVIPFSAHF